MKNKIVLTVVLLVSALILVQLTHSPAPVFDLKGIYKGVCWTGEPRELPGDAIDIVKAYGVEWISQTPFGWMRTQHTPSVKFSSHHGWWGETDEGIRTTTRQAHEKGIKVMLKPHLWITRPINGGWRDKIDFASEELWQQWEAGYTRFIMHYAQLAREEKIEILCIGMELKHSVESRPQYWKQLIRRIRSVYPGKLTYAANWYQEFNRIAIWSDLDYISIQGYFPLTDKQNPTVEEIAAGWQPHVQAIEAVSKKYNKPVILTEIGYTNTRGATIKPWQWSEDIPLSQLDHSEQVNAYEALFRTFANKDWLAGIFIWKWYPSHGRIRANRIDFSPQNKPAGDVLRKWYMSPAAN